VGNDLGYVCRKTSRNDRASVRDVPRIVTGLRRGLSLQHSDRSRQSGDLKQVSTPVLVRVAASTRRFDLV
jgi:hypothetical protein